MARKGYSDNIDYFLKELTEAEAQNFIDQVEENGCYGCLNGQQRNIKT